MKIKKIFMLGLLLASALTAGAQSDDEERKNMASLHGGASADSWNIELGYTRMLNRYVGIGAGIQVDKENGDGGMLGEIIRSSLQPDDYYEDYDDTYITRFSLLPAITLRTPTLHLFHKQEDSGDGLLLQVEPGMMLTLPANDRQWMPDWSRVVSPPAGSFVLVDVPQVRVSNTGGRWCYWRVRSSVCYKVGPGLVGIGYACSNYSIFDCRRHMLLHGQPVHQYPTRRLTHTFSASLSFAF